MFGHNQKKSHTKWFKFNLKRPHHGARMVSTWQHMFSALREKVGRVLISSEAKNERAFMLLLGDVDTVRNSKIIFEFIN